MGLLPVSSSLARPGSPVDSTQIFYARRDAKSLKRLLDRASTREMDLLCRYRLYPLTQDPSLIENLPTELERPTARELALLSGLWGYRVVKASILSTPTLGLRSHRLLEQAKALDPDEPLVLLIEGQSLLFRPTLFGGDTNAALDRFRTLRDRLEHTPDKAVSAMEANLWVWYTLNKMKLTDAADALKADLLAAAPPPLYRQFLLDPP